MPAGEEDIPEVEGGLCPEREKQCVKKEQYEFPKKKIVDSLTKRLGFGLEDESVLLLWLRLGLLMPPPPPSPEVEDTLVLLGSREVAVVSCWWCWRCWWRPGGAANRRRLLALEIEILEKECSLWLFSKCQVF